MISTVTAAAGGGVADRVPFGGDATRILSHHGRTFRFAARLLPPESRARLTRLYAYCRITDDLVDRMAGNDRAVAERLLDEWIALSRRAYDGGSTEIALLDAVMRDAAASRVPFAYAADLAEGMRMDLRQTRYATLDELRVYTYRVAAVVGRWITELFGAHEPHVLAHAGRLGHAMQLTNILRDIGEDWRAGRLYLPSELLERHRVSTRELEGEAARRLTSEARWHSLMEDLMAIADADYTAAFPWIPQLPGAVQPGIAVAARVYGGIHDRIRRNGYDALSRRAYTTTTGKVRLATLALTELRRARSHCMVTRACAA